MKHTLVVLVSALALLVGATAASAAVPETVLKPAQLERGPNVAIPHLVDKTIVDGDVRVEVDGGAIVLLGKSGDDYVVGTANRSGSGKFRVFRYTPEGSRTLLFRDTSIFELQLSDDGAQITAVRYDAERTRIRVISAVDGSEDARRWFNGSVSVLDLDGGVMALGGWSPNRTFLWTVAEDTTDRISGRVGSEADLSADRLASLTKDPYLGGCSVVSTLTDPGTRKWRSCHQRVHEFSPDGRRMATVDILSDGIGPSDVWLHRAGGKTLAHYSAQWFGAVEWETDTALLLETNGKHKAAVVRCVVADCERASKLRPRPDFRSVPGRALGSDLRPAWRP